MQVSLRQQSRRQGGRRRQSLLMANVWPLRLRTRRGCAIREQAAVCAQHGVCLALFHALLGGLDESTE